MDWNIILGQALAPILSTVCIIVAGLLGKLITHYIKNSKSQADDRLAAIAVAWAEDQLGKGEKLEGAAKKLAEMSGGKISNEQAKVLVAASYQRLMGELSPLKK